jgi:hypothetical protein
MSVIAGRLQNRQYRPHYKDQDLRLVPAPSGNIRIEPVDGPRPMRAIIDPDVS